MVPTADQVRQWRFRWPAVAIGSLLALYISSYAALYQRGLAEAEAYGYDYFFYVPVADVIAVRDTTYQHQLLLSMYCPLNDLHHRWFGGRVACKCILFAQGP